MPVRPKPARPVNHYRGEYASAAVMGVDRFGVDADVNEVDEATHTGLELGEHPSEDPG